MEVKEIPIVIIRGEELELPDNFTNTFERINHALSRGDYFADRSFSFNVPPTPRNCRLLGNVHLIEVESNFDEIACEFILMGISLPGKIKVWRAGKNGFEVNLRFGVFALDIMDKPLSEIPLQQIDNFDTWIANDEFDPSATWPDVNFTLPMIYAPKFFGDDEASDVTNRKNPDYEGFINLWDRAELKQRLRRNRLAAFSFLPLNVTSIVPQVFVRHVLEKGFELAGLKMSGEILSHPDIKRMYVFNNKSADGRIKKEYVLARASDKIVQSQNTLDLGVADWTVEVDTDSKWTGQSYSTSTPTVDDAGNRLAVFTMEYRLSDDTGNADNAEITVSFRDDTNANTPFTRSFTIEASEFDMDLTEVFSYGVFMAIGDFLELRPRVKVEFKNGSTVLSSGELEFDGASKFEVWNDSTSNLLSVRPSVNLNEFLPSITFGEFLSAFMSVFSLHADVINANGNVVFKQLNQGQQSVDWERHRTSDPTIESVSDPRWIGFKSVSDYKYEESPFHGVEVTRTENKRLVADESQAIEIFEIDGTPLVMEEVEFVDDVITLPSTGIEGDIEGYDVSNSMSDIRFMFYRGLKIVPWSNYRSVSENTDAVLGTLSLSFDLEDENIEGTTLFKWAHEFVMQALVKGVQVETELVNMGQESVSHPMVSPIVLFGQKILLKKLTLQTGSDFKILLSGYRI